MSRSRRRIKYLAAAGVALAYVVVLVLYIRSSGGGSDADSLLAQSGSGSPSDQPGFPSASGSPLASGFPSGPATGPIVIGGSTGPGITINPVIPGGIRVGNLPSHKIVLTATSTSAIKRVGFLVPTSLDNSYGDIRNVGTSWSLTTTAYGNPAYAEVFIQSGPGGASITCSITVDGKQSNSETTKGPYGRQVCIG